MSLWVRSQNKENLMDIDVVEISEYGVSKPKAYNIESHCYVLGTYSTKRKALKVLEWIQIHLLDLENSKNMSFTLNNFVFQMPKDDEVEEDE